MRCARRLQACLKSMRTLSFAESLQSLRRSPSRGLKVGSFALFPLRLLIEQVDVDAAFDHLLQVVQHVLRVERFQFVNGVVTPVAFAEPVVVTG